MPSTSSLGAILQVLGEVAQYETPTIKYHELLEMSAARYDAKSEAPLDHDALTLEFVRHEIQARRLVVEEIGPIRTVTLSPSGIIYYRGYAGRAPNASVMNKWNSRKAKAQAEYLLAATTLAAIVGILEARENPMMLSDARNLPQLVREYLNTVQYMEEANQDVIDQIRATQERLDNLVRRVT
ncbi:hypothetical protein C8Q73DRAFT_794581 [Cubamyces lactineus]|nr:hypothetical protein C8Q73DRAFT_794581 [Cubamyces lactineus]